jgi:hypothetical protein
MTYQEIDSMRQGLADNTTHDFDSRIAITSHAARADKTTYHARCSLGLKTIRHFFTVQDTVSASALRCLHPACKDASVGHYFTPNYSGQLVLSLHLCLCISHVPFPKTGFSGIIMLLLVTFDLEPFRSPAISAASRCIL